MAGKRKIKGIVLSIGADTKAVQEGFAKADESIRKTQKELKSVQGAMKLNPESAELAAQKQELLAQAIEETAGKLNELKANQDKVAKAFAANDEWEEKYEPLAESIDTAYEKLQKLYKQQEKAEKLLADGKMGQDKFDALQKEIDETKTAFNDLISEREKLESSFENGHMNAEEYRAYRREVEATEGKLKSLRAEYDNASGAAEQLDGMNEQLADSTADTGDSAEQAADGFTVMKGALADLAADGIRQAIDEMKELAVESEKAANSFAAATGTTADEMDGYSAQMEQIYKHNYGDSLTDIADAMALIKQNARDMGVDEVGELTEKALMLRDVFGFDVNETMRAANMLIDQFGINGQQAFTLIAQGAQNGLDKNGDLLDSINEYAVHYKQLGYDSEEFFNSLENGTAAGTFSVDKLGDAMKEFGIRAKDTADSTTGGFELIGLDADKMRDSFAEGGESAQQAMQTTLDALFDVDDAVTRNQAGVDLFGTMWEDLGESGVKALTDVSGKADITADTLKEIESVKYSDTASRLEEVGRTIQLEVLKPLIDDLLPAAEKGADWAAEHLPVIKAGIVGIGTAFAALKLAEGVSSVTAQVGALTTALKSGEGAATALSGALEVNPYAAAFAAAAAAAMVAKTAIDDMTDAIDETCDNYDDLTEAQKELVDQSEEVTNAITDSIESRKDSRKAVEDEADEIDTLKKRLYELDDAQTLDAKSKAEMQAIVEKLNSSVPDLNIALDEQTGHLKTSRSEIDKTAESYKKMAKAQVAKEQLADISRDVADAEELMKKNFEAYEAAKKSRDEIQKQLDDFEKTFSEDMSKSEKFEWYAEEDGLKKQLEEAQSAVGALGDEYTTSCEQVRELNEELDDSAEAAANAASEADGAADAVEDTAKKYDALKDAIGPTAKDMVENVTVELGGQTVKMSQEAYKQISDLQKTYEDAVSDRAKDIGKSLDPFEKFPDVADKSVEGMFESLQTNKDAVAEWSDGIQELAARGLSDGLIAELEEAGPQSVAEIRALKQMSESQLKDYSKMWEDMNARIRLASEREYSGMKTDISRQVRDIAGVPLTYKALMTDNWLELGAAACLGMADGMLNNLPEITEASESIKNAVSLSLLKGNGEFRERARELADNMADGFVQGLDEKWQPVYNAGMQVGITALNALQAALDAHSPSRKTIAVGGDFDAGLAGGIEDEQDTVWEKASAVAQGALGALQNGLDGGDSIRTMFAKIADGITADTSIDPISVQTRYVSANAPQGIQTAQGGTLPQTAVFNMNVNGRTIAAVSAPFLDVINGANVKLAARGGAV